MDLSTTYMGLKLKNPKNPIIIRSSGISGNKVSCDRVASTDIRYDTALIKQILVGARAVEVCSAIFQNGIPHIAKMPGGLENWMEKHNFEKPDDFRGKSPDYQTTDARFERIQYRKRDFEEIF